MSRRRLRALVRRVVVEIRRDRPSLALLFIAPILVTGLFTFILRDSSGPDVHVAVATQGSGPAAALIAGKLEGALAGAGMTVTHANSVDEARGDVRDGSATIAILLPANLAPGAGSKITLLTKGLDPSGDTGQIAAVSQALLGGLASSMGAVLPAITRETVYGTPSSDPMAPFAPAIVAFFLYFFVYLLTGVSFLRERTGGTLERLMATPVTRGEVVTGYTLGFGFFAMLQVAILLTWALVTVRVPAVGPLPDFAIGLGISVAGSPLLAFVVVLLLALGAVSLGIFLSTFARTELQVIQFIPVVLVPQFLLSGVLFSVDSLPSVLQPLVHIMPLAYAVDALREVFIRGADLSVTAVQVDLAVLAVVAVLFAAVASRTIRRDVV
ncbi:MAG TPA: ABC transporter permease [Candidatus Limnocylindrales bacterium]